LVGMIGMIGEQADERTESGPAQPQRTRSMKVWIDRNVCEKDLIACQSCFAQLVFSGVRDQSCVLAYKDDGGENLTIVLHSQEGDEMLIIPPHLRERVSRAGWGKYTRLLESSAPRAEQPVAHVEAAGGQLKTQTLMMKRGEHRMAQTRDTYVPPGDRTKTRRGFLGWAIGAIGAAIAAVMSIPAVAYVVSPALKKKETEWIPLGSIRKVEIGIPTLFKAKIVRKQGWEETVSNETMYALTEDGENFVVLSNVCTHLGCRVHWDSGKNGFFCPCHGAVFDKHGNVVSGPPPRPLDSFETKVETGKLFILGG